MGDPTRHVHVAARHERDRPLRRVPRPADVPDGEFLAAVIVGIEHDLVFLGNADHADPAADGGHVVGLRRTRRAVRALEDDVGPAAVGQRHDGLDRVGGLGVDDVVGAVGLREREAIVQPVGHDDPLGAGQPRHRKAPQADGPRPDDRHGLARPRADDVRRMDGHLERFKHGRLFKRHAVGYRDALLRLQDDRLADESVARRRAAELDGRAHVRLVGQAPLALTAVAGRLDGHAPADLQALDAGPDLQYLARPLVADDLRLLDDLVADAAVLVVVNVGPADADRPDANLDLPRAGLRFRPILHPQVADAV